jgi:hypothetical protein
VEWDKLTCRYTTDNRIGKKQKAIYNQIYYDYNEV